MFFLIRMFVPRSSYIYVRQALLQLMAKHTLQEPTIYKTTNGDIPQISLC